MALDSADLFERVGTNPVMQSIGGILPVQLVVITNMGVAYHPLPAFGEVPIGRSRSNGIQIPDPAISRCHAVIEAGSTLRIRDAGSSNGVWVNKVRLAPHQAIELLPGDTIRLGPVVVLVQIVTTGAQRAANDAIPGIRNPEPKWAGAGAQPIVVLEPAMRQLFAMVERIASSKISVLLLGETGVGKEVFAAAVHRASNRSNKTFVGLNCAALSPTLLESELFGHERGAFTGAAQSKPGLIESADGGTVFLDEIGEFPLALQSKLLRVLEQREVLRVGSLTPRPVDVRFVAATNRDLESEVAKGNFRSDLFFRLNGITLEIPPLRERGSEVESLARLFADRAATAMGRPGSPVLTVETMTALRNYEWPGNIRELRNVIDRAVLLAGDEWITPAHLPTAVAGASATRSAEPVARPHDFDQLPTMRCPGDEDSTILGGEDEADRQRILEALEQCAGNQTRAALLLGIPRRTLTKRLTKYEIPRPRKRA